MAQFNWGWILIQKNELDAGIKYLREAAMERPNDAKANTGLADALRGEGQLDEAIMFYKKALASTPDYVAANVGLAVAMEEKGELEGAIVHYRAALQQEPNSPDIHYDLANILLRNGQIDEAMAEARLTLALEPNFPDAHVTLGNIFLRQNDEHRALAEYESALRVSPPSAIAQNNVAWVLATASDHALRNGARAIQLAQESARCVASQNPFGAVRSDDDLDDTREDDVEVVRGVALAVQILTGRHRHSFADRS